MTACAKKEHQTEAALGFDSSRAVSRGVAATILIFSRRHDVDFGRSY
jgi:hypothetical protein